MTISNTNRFEKNEYPFAAGIEDSSPATNAVLHRIAPPFAGTNPNSSQ
jgi:hypothetical protein